MIYLRMNENDSTPSFLTSKSAIFDELVKSRNHGQAVGIWCPALGVGMFLCVVKDILTDEDEDDIAIVLKENSLLSQRMDSYVIYLGEIERVYAFAPKSPQAIRKQDEF